jgi:hypothetical protein
MTQENENQPKKHLFNNKIDDIYSLKIKDEKNVVRKEPFLILASLSILGLIVSLLERIAFYVGNLDGYYYWSVGTQFLIILLTSIIFIMVGFSLENYINKERFKKLVSLNKAFGKTVLIHFCFLAIILLLFELFIISVPYLLLLLFIGFTIIYLIRFLLFWVI